MSIPIPSGECSVKFDAWHNGEKQHFLIRCDIEVMMVAFTTDKCRIRGTILESIGPYTEGDTFGGKDTDLTEDILAVVTRSLVDR